MGTPSRGCDCESGGEWRSGSGAVGAVSVRRTGCHLTGVGERRAA